MKLPFKHRVNGKIDENFEEYYQNHILPLKGQLESQREIIYKKESKNKLFAVLLCVGSTVGIFMIPKIWAGRTGKAFGKFMVAMYSGIWWLCVGRHRTKYFTTAKTHIMPLLTKYLGDFTYDVKGKIDPDIIRKHLIFSTRFGIGSEDYISGTHNGTKVEIAETTLTNGHKTFKGLLILIHAVALSDATIIIKPCDTYFQFREKRKMKKRSLILSKTYNTNLDAKLKTYVNKEDTAKKFLTPEFINQLVGLNKKFGGDEIRFSYLDKNILVAISCPDNMFEPAAIHTMSVNTIYIKRMLHEIAEVLEIAETLKKEMNKIE